MILAYTVISVLLASHPSDEDLSAGQARASCLLTSFFADAGNAGGGGEGDLRDGEAALHFAQFSATLGFELFRVKVFTAWVAQHFNGLAKLAWAVALASSLVLRRLQNDPAKQ